MGPPNWCRRCFELFFSTLTAEKAGCEEAGWQEEEADSEVHFGLHPPCRGWHHGRSQLCKCRSFDNFDTSHSTLKDHYLVLLIFFSKALGTFHTQVLIMGYWRL